jgi:hypothetical protein
VFKPYTIREMGDLRIAVVGQSFPYTPIANPQRFIPDWTFGINEGDMQEIVDQARDEENPDGLIVISHNGMDVDLKMAARVSGIDAIFGGHTHDGVPGAVPVSNPGGKTLVTNAGSNGKFLGVMDMDYKGKKLREFKYRLLPIFSNLLPADAEMTAYIEKVRKPHLAKLQQELSVAEDVLFRRGNFNGTFDQVICDALRVEGDAQISLSPGFRWGTTVLPGQAITMKISNLSSRMWQTTCSTRIRITSRAATWCGSADWITVSIRRPVPASASRICSWMTAASSMPRKATRLPAGRPWARNRRAHRYGMSWPITCAARTRYASRSSIPRS